MSPQQTIAHHRITAKLRGVGTGAICRVRATRRRRLPIAADYFFGNPEIGPFPITARKRHSRPLEQPGPPFWLYHPRHNAGETERMMKEAIEFHLQGLREDGLPIPEPVTTADYITAA